MRLDPAKFREILTLATNVHLRKEMGEEAFHKWMESSDAAALTGEFVDEVMAHMRQAGFLDG